MNLSRPRLARMVMLLACFIGLFASGYLFYTYVTGANITCAIVSGCDIVRASKWAYVYGIPRPLFGLLFYAGVFASLVIRSITIHHKERLRRWTLVPVIFAFLESVYLFIVQWKDIKAFCFWCLTSGVAATLLLLASLFDRPEQNVDVATSRELRFYFIAWLIYLPLAFALFIFLTLHSRV